MKKRLSQSAYIPFFLSNLVPFNLFKQFNFAIKFKNQNLLKSVSKFSLLFLFLILSAKSNAQTAVTPDGGFTSATQYATPGEYTVTIPAGITLIEVKLWGGGGGCGASIGTTDNTGGPGGFTEARFVVTPGQQYKLVVGSGGGSDDEPPTVSIGFPGDRPANCSGGQGGGLSGFFTGTSTVVSTDMARALLIAGGGGGASGFNSPLGWARGGSGNLAAPLSGGEANMKGINQPSGCLPYELGGGGGGYSGGSAHNRAGGGNAQYPVNAGGGNGGTAYVHSSATLSTVSGTPDWSHLPPQTSDFHYVTPHARGAINPHSTNVAGGNGLAVIQFGVAMCSSPPTLTLSASSGTTCGTTAVTVSGNTFGGSATSVTITENGAGTVTPTSAGTSPFSFTYSPAAADGGNTITITVITDNPLGAPCVPDTAIYLLNVNSCTEVCMNGVDDDGDGLIDSFDPDCPCSDSSYHNLCTPSCTYTFTPDSFEMDFTHSMDSVFDFQSVFTGDVDNDGEIEIVVFSNHVNSLNIQTWCPTSHYVKDIYIYNAVTGVKEYTINTPYVSAFSANQFAFADIDNDGISEIVIETASQTIDNSICGGGWTNHPINSLADANKLICYELNGSEIWRTSSTIGVNITNSGVYPSNATSYKYGSSIGFADFNADGNAEVYVYNEIYNAQSGVLLAHGGANGIGFNNEIPFIGSYNGINATQSANDVIPSDPGVELIAGNTVYLVNLTNAFGLAGNTMTAINAPGARVDGLTAVADFDLDGELDVLTSGNNGSSKTYIWNPRTVSLIAQRTVYAQTQANGPYYGQPFVGDVDGDGLVEVGYGQANYMVLFDYDSSSTTMSYKYHLNSIDGSQRTCMSMFDFNQDDAMEIIYRDQDRLMIIDGITGNMLSEFPCKSGTAYEYPTVSDIDNDGQAEILCTCLIDDGGDIFNPSISEVRVFEALSKPWAPSRSVWNQWSYHSTNINDDLSVPLNIQNHASVGNGSTRLNFFIAQSSIYDINGDYVFPAADAIGSFSVAPSDFCDDDTIHLSVVIKNIGNTIMPSGLPISFYGSNPMLGGALLYSTVPSSPIVTAVSIAPGDSILLSVALIVNPLFTSVWMSVNDDASITPPISFPVTAIAECNYLNNIFNLGIPNCACANPPVVSLSATSGSACGTTPITVSGNTFGGSATSVTITENGAGSVTPTSASASPFSFTYTPAAGDAGNTVTITVTTNNPLGAPCAAATAIYTLTVNATPTLGGPSSVCVGSTATVTPTTGGTWASSNTGVATVTNSGVVTGVSSGTVTLIFIDSNNCENTKSFIVESCCGLIVNGGFENNINSNCTYYFPSTNPNGIYGWTVLNDGGSGGCDALLGNLSCGLGVHSGLWAVDLQPHSNASGNFSCQNTYTTGIAIQQNVNLVIGQSYTLTFYGAALGSSSNDIELKINNTVVQNYNFSATYRQFIYTFTPTTTSNTIRFINRNNTGAVTAIDDVCLNLVCNIVLGGSTSVCVGSTATVTPTTGGTWTSSNTGIATVTNAGVVTGVAVGTVTLTFTETSTGCSNTKTVTVNATPTMSLISGPTCNGTSTAYSITINNTAGVNIASASATNGTVTVSGTEVTVSGIPSGSGTVVSVTDANGCTASFNQASVDCTIPCTPVQINSNIYKK